MATLSELDGGPLQQIDVLPGHEMPWRHLYGTNAFLEWMNNVLPSLVSTTIGAQLTPLEQVYASFDEYASGEPFNDDRRFKRLAATPDHFVWEFKTDDIRVFGWIPYKDCFVATFGDLKDEIVTFNRYGLYIAQTAFFRANLDLDEPGYVASKEYKDVLSDKPE